MLSADQLTVFLSASIVLAITPGPDNLYVLSQSALYQRWAGLMITLGLCTGLAFHTFAIAFGLTGLIAASPVLFNTIRYIGVVYLIYLAWKAFQASHLALGEDGRQKSPLQYYLTGIAMNVSNPKVLLFFLAFLPQFIEIDQGQVTSQAMIVGGLFILVTLVVFSSYALLADLIRDSLVKHPHRQHLMNQLTGLMLLAVAAHIAFLSF